jgi:hypothetical protein
MMKTVIQLLFLSCILLYLCSCTSSNLSEKDKSFSEFLSVPLNEMNKEIRFFIIEDDGQDKFRIGDSVNLGLENKSRDRVVFPSDYGIRIYTYDQNYAKWTEVTNKENYYPPGNTQISPKGVDVPGIIVVTFLPDLPITSDAVELRVVIIGTVYKDDAPTDEEVGAYIDITLQP